MAANARNGGSYKAYERITAYAMFAPAAILLTVFLIVPFVLAFGLSLTDQPLVPRLETVTDPQTGETIQRQRPPDFIGLENYQELLRLKLFVVDPQVDEETGEIVRDENGNPVFERSRTYLRPERLEELVQIDLFGKRYLLGAGDATFYRSLLNILYFVIVVVPLQTSLALLLAILVNQKIVGANLYRTIYFSPVVTAMAIVAVLWFFLYNPDEGLINTFLGALGLGPYQWLEHPASAMPAIILMSIWQGVGFQMVIFLAGLQEIPEALYEASALDGANIFQQFRYITLPSLRNTTLFVIISTTILAFKLFVQVDVMTFGRGGPQNATITTVLHMVNEGFRSSQQVGYASAIAVIFVIIVLSISLIQRRILEQED
ncbi:MAG: sugar ABC transporter permease [Anaerolineae bacterium]